MNCKTENITFILVNKNDQKHIKLLFKILNERKYFISNKKETRYEDHSDFVKNNPYRKWFFVLNNGIYIGTCYLTYQNMIGINLIKDNSLLYKETIIKLKGIIKPLKPKLSVRNKKFSINVPIQNKNLQNALDGLNAIPLQITYKID